MNQILYSGGKKEKNNITKIVKAFCIIIIVFSLFCKEHMLWLLKIQKLR